MTRAGRDKWLAEGLAVLAASGPRALSVELLAARLGVQRASFAWHFGDLERFKAELVEHWSERALDGDGERVFAGDPRAERAMRVWALDDATIRAAVERVDAKRLARLTAIHGGDAELALLEHAVYVGASWLFDDPSARKDLEAALARALDALRAQRSGTGA